MLLLDSAERITLPNSPLDELTDELGGPSKVAEMKRRKGFVGRNNRTEKPCYIERGTERNNVKEMLL